MGNQANENNRGNGVKPTPRVRQRSVSYPRYTLQQAEKLARKVLDEGARHCDNDKVAKGTGYSGANNGAYVALRSTAGQFGLVVASGGFISLTEEWINAFASDSVDDLKRARQNAMQLPELYKLLIEEYRDKQIPSPEKLAQQLYLNQRYGITKEASQVAAQVFLDSASYAGLLDVKGFLRIGTSVNAETVDVESVNEVVTAPFEVGDVNDRQEIRNVQSTTRVDQIVKTVPELDKHEMRLRNGQKAYLLVPVPLPKGEKERLKALIDLILEDDEFAAD